MLVKEYKSIEVEVLDRFLFERDSRTPGLVILTNRETKEETELPGNSEEAHKFCEAYLKTVDTQIGYVQTKAVGANLKQVFSELDNLRQRSPILTEDQVREGYRIWNLWEEGYLCTGMEGIPDPAKFLGTFIGKTLAEAAANYGVEKTAIYSKYGFSDKGYEIKIKNGKPYCWVCEIFDNEEDARKSFG